MKLTKEDLKGIVKECLVELLSEGLGGSSNLTEGRQATRSNQMPATRQVEGRASSQSSQQARSSVYDKLAFAPTREQVQQTAPVSKKINPLNMVKDITSDPVLAGILAETATSGQHMNMGERDRPTHDDQIMSGGDAAARKMLVSDPTELFGESASMWSTLAFPETSRK
jgi:hypothetical protein